MVLAHARALAEGGHLHDALAVVDRVDLADPLWTEAVTLRGDIQRRLLGTAFSAADSPAPAGIDTGESAR